MRRVLFFNEVADQTPVTVDVNGDGLADTGAIGFNQSAQFDIATTQLSIRIQPTTPDENWLEFPIPTGATGADSAAVVMMALHGNYWASIAAADRSTLLMHRHYADPRAFSSRVDLPNPRLQLVNLAWPTADGGTRDLYADGRLIMADAGYGAVSPPFSVSAAAPIAYATSPRGGAPAMFGSTLVTFPAGGVGLVALADGYNQPIAVRDLRINQPPQAIFNVVHAYGTTAAPDTIYGGNMQADQLTLDIHQSVSGATTLSPSHTLQSFPYPATLRNLAIKLNSPVPSNTVPFFKVGGFNWSGRVVLSFFSRLRYSATFDERRVVQVQAPSAAYGLYEHVSTQRPCEQTWLQTCTVVPTVCSPGVHGCP